VTFSDVFQAGMLSKLRKGYVSVASDSPSLTLSSTVDINRNTNDLTVDIGQCATELAVNTDCHQTTVRQGVAASTCCLSTCTTGCSSSPTSGTDHGVGSTGETKPILRPPKKRRINLTLDESSDRSAEASRLFEVSPPLSGVDLTEWTGQRVLAQRPTDSVYWPGLIKSISTMHSPVGIQFDGGSEDIWTSADNVISDSAPPSAGVFVGMRVCARLGSDRVEYHLGVVRERVVQSPVTKFLVELDASYVTTNVTSSVWVSRASLRLLQVPPHSLHWCCFIYFTEKFRLTMDLGPSCE